MEVLKRFRDSDGRLVGYLLSDAGKEFTVSAKQVKQYKGLLSNADVLSNGVVRAKRGGYIETVVVNLRKPNNSSGHTKKITFGGRLEKAQGWDVLSDCRDIRKYAMLGKVVLDTTVHRVNKENLHLFEFIRNCGWDVREFILGYLSCLQPYDLKPLVEGREIPKGHVWLLSLGYRYSMVLKLRKDSQYGDGVIISFHESRKYNQWGKGDIPDSGDEKCMVIVDGVRNVWGRFSVLFTVQRGFIRRQFTADVSNCFKGVAVVSRKLIDDMFRELLNDHVRELFNLYIGGSENPLVGKFELKDLTFTSYGFHTLNSICLLVDLSRVSTGKVSKQVVYTLLDDILSEVPDALVEEYHKALQKRYVVGDPSYAYEFADWYLGSRYKEISEVERERMKRIRDTWLK